MNENVLRLAQRTAITLESVSGNQFQEILTEINNTLDYQEKVFLALLVQECLLGKHDNQFYNTGLVELFTGTGIDDSLILKFRGFLEQDNPLTVNNGEFLLISPRNVTDNEMLEGSWIEDNAPGGRDFTGNIALDQLTGHLVVMFVEQTCTYIIKSINSSVNLFEGDDEFRYTFRFLSPGDELSISGVTVLTYSDLKARFLQAGEKRGLTVSIDQVQYANSSGIKEIYSFSSEETTGSLIGIVGREGAGKSTLLKLLAGKFKPASGRISINGYDLWKNKYVLKGVIGFVPEEDLLLEDLSVADNLVLTARLYYSSLSRKEIETKVDTLLRRLDITDIRDEIAGTVDNKQIQPGQRRLVNIALELLREPQILLVDNALSGLGMSDACRVIRVLHKYSFAGNLVITSISQVDSETFHLFDKIWILDKDGHPVYNGAVNAARAYLLKNLNLSYRKNEATDPARLLDLVNYRFPDKYSHVPERVMEPSAWHDQYMRELALQNTPSPQKTLLPARIMKIPDLEIQLLIFFIRNFKCKFSRAGELIKVLLTGPVAAFIIAILLRTGSGEGDYTFLSNANIPFYQFVSVVVAVFFGLISSADEIIRERNILEKEEYLEFSRFSYLNSKILYLFPILAVQILLYVVTGNLILSIKEMFWLDWIVLFSSACFGAMLGLVISSAFKSRHIIYKAVLPIVIAVQLLLGGGIISYDRLNIGDHRFTPFIGDFMVSRWGYEALAVEHFKSNSFEKLFYATDQKLDEAAFYAFQAIPTLEQLFYSCLSSNNTDSIQHNIRLLQNEFRKAAFIPDVSPFEYINSLPAVREKEEIAEGVIGYLTYLGYHFHDQYDTMNIRRTALIRKLADSLGAPQLARLRQDYHNLALEETVTQNNIEEAYNITDDEVIRKTGAIFTRPGSEWGRAALFSPVKIFNGQQTETLWFNLAMIWLLTSVCYIWVLFDLTGIIKGIRY